MMKVDVMNKLFIWGIIIFHIYIIYYNKNDVIVKASKSSTNYNTIGYQKNNIHNNNNNDNNNNIGASSVKCPIKLAKSFFKSSLFLNSFFITRPTLKSIMTTNIMKKNLNLIDFSKESNILGIFSCLYTYYHHLHHSIIFIVSLSVSVSPLLSSLLSSSSSSSLLLSL